MKNYFLFLLLISLFFSFFVFAGNDPAGELFGIIARLTNVLFWLLMAVSGVFVMLSAYQFLFSGGDPSKVSAAKKNLLYCVIAIIVALFATGFSAIIQSIIL